MVEFTDSFLYKLRFLAAGVLIIACLLLLPFLPQLILIDPTVKAANKSSVSTIKKSDMNDSPNAVTRAMVGGASSLEQIAGSTEQTVTNSFRAATNSITSATVKSGKFVAHGVGNSVAFTGKTAGKGFTLVAHGAGNAFSSIAKTSVVSALIRPADTNKTSVPVIDDDAYVFANASAEKNDNQLTAQPVSDSEASWPMHGVITTRFGVPHWPWQPVHTGIDISDQKASGITPIHPFKPGVVSDIVRSNVGLGNHVIVDHGERITSVYAHLSSISVRVGQEVNSSTTVGYEGSTGASTGTHLHFEIRLNGQPVDPRKYIDGQP